MTNCDEIKKYLEKSFDADELSPELEPEIAEHLVSCASCRDFYDELASLDGALKSAGVRMPEEPYWDSYAAGIAGKTDRGRTPGRGSLFSFSTFLYMSSAAAVLIFMAVMYFYFKYGNSGLHDASTSGGGPDAVVREEFGLDDFILALDEYSGADNKVKENLRDMLKRHTVEVYEFSVSVIKNNSYSIEQKKNVIEIAGAMRILLLKRTLAGLLSDGNLCYNAVDALIAIDGKNMIPEWKMLLGREGFQVLAVYALFKTDYEIAVFETAIAYDGLQPAVQRYVEEMAVNSGKMESARKILHGMLLSGNSVRQRNALRVLGAVKDGPSAVLIASMAGDAGLRDAVLEALSGIGGVSALNRLAGVLCEEDFAGFVTSIATESNRRDIAAVLCGLLVSDSVAVKRTALDLLKDYGSAEDAVKIAGFANDQRIAKEIIYVIGAIGDEKVLKFLTIQMQAGRYGKEAVAAIGGLDTEKSIPVLIKALDTENTRKDAYTMLKEKTGEDFGRNSLRWRQWWQKSHDEKSSGMDCGFSNC